MVELVAITTILGWAGDLALFLIVLLLGGIFIGLRSLGVRIDNLTMKVVQNATAIARLEGLEEGRKQARRPGG